MLKIIDFNNDGTVSIEEFKGFIYNNLGQNKTSIDQKQIEHFVQNVK